MKERRVTVLWQHDLGDEEHRLTVRLSDEVLTVEQRFPDCEVPAHLRRRFGGVVTPRDVLHRAVWLVNSTKRGWAEVRDESGQVLCGHPTDPRRRYPEE